MFSESTTLYRAGINFTISEGCFAFSRQCFMQHFIAFMQEKVNSIPATGTLPDKVTLNNIDAFFRVSQLVTTSENVAKESSHISSELQLIINDRTLRHPNYANGYIYDDELVKKFPKYFTADISYLAMARYLVNYLKENKLDDAAIANDVIEIMTGHAIKATADVVPIMIAALFIAEAKRNPSCFIPSLMCVELIRNKIQNPFGTDYEWQNCLQNPILVNQYSETRSVHRDCIYPRMSGMPTFFSLQNNEKITLDQHQKEFINAEKKYNKKCNQTAIATSEVHMQHGGFFPNTHRFSYAELKAKRQEGKETMSDMKSFIIISDWLMMGGVADCIHQKYLHNKTRSPHLDEHVDLLREKIFPFMWDAFVSQNALSRLILADSPANTRVNPNF